MRACVVPGCTVDATGKMLACSPHWSFLTEELRVAIRDQYDLLEAERKAGDVHRATRNRWAELVGQAVVQWEHERARLQRGMERRLPPDGLSWRRRQRELELEAARAAPA